jgi:Arc/MetJ-type ribon-helix-helix transcriptional regulator
MAAEPLPRVSSLDEHAEEQSSAAELLSAVHDLGKASPEFQAAVMRLLGARPSDLGRLRLVGRARKVSVSMPEDLTAAVQQRVGRGEFSHYVTEAVARQLELDLLGELAALLETEHGPVSDEALDEARRSWPDAR